ncbi:GtrA family protein [Candidatus Saccharibacteria bacterium]|nr:GtrA family protein [Candidatus Saccharibacteria bacterium]MCL1963205.1 GtrA family protein [Candidatus Saccharibacteria bacterium]
MKKSLKNLTNNTKAVYVAVGVFVTLVNYVMYLILAPIFVENAWFAVAGSGFVAVITGLVLHSHLTWRNRDNTKSTAVKFLIYNLILITTLQPMLEWFFKQSFWNWLYDFAFWLTAWVGWSADFVRRTGVFGLMACVTMIVNFLVYDRIVFVKLTTKPESATKNKKRD